MIVRLLSVVVLGFAVVSCGSSSDSGVASDVPTLGGVDVPDETENTDVTVFDGGYDLSVISRTETGNDGGTCSDASGQIVVTDGVISGTAESGSGFVFDVTGEVTGEGEVYGGFAVSGSSVASYAGTFNEGTVTGVWVENTGCSGTWRAEATI